MRGELGTREPGERSLVFMMRLQSQPRSIPVGARTFGGAESSESGATLRLRCPEHGSGLSHESRSALSPGSRPCSLKLRPQRIIRLRSPPPHLLSFVCPESWAELQSCRAKDASGLSCSLLWKVPAKLRPAAQPYCPSKGRMPSLHMRTILALGFTRHVELEIHDNSNSFW